MVPETSLFVDIIQPSQAVVLGNMLPTTECYVAREQFWNDIKYFNPFPAKEEIESWSKFEKSLAVLLKES
jgi:hypothetical protein